MKLLLLIIEIVLISIACASDIQKFRDAKIIPDIIDDFEASKMLNVTFLVPLEGGAQLTPNEVRSEPEVSWDTMEGDFYSILLTDCGVHSEDVVEVRNWLVMNIPGSDVSKGETIAEFIGAMPMEVILKNKYLQESRSLDFLIELRHASVRFLAFPSTERKSRQHGANLKSKFNGWSFQSVNEKTHWKIFVKTYRWKLLPR